MSNRPRRCRAIATAMRLGLVVGRRHRRASRVVLQSRSCALQWYLDGTTIGGVQTRGDDGSARAAVRRWRCTPATTAFMANDDDKRGTLEPGKFADLAVLSADYHDGSSQADREDQDRC